ncbi:MAG: hypothetical protein ACJA2S_003816, partial [Cyclobacteriaceae bacterium]
MGWGVAIPSEKKVLLFLAYIRLLDAVALAFSASCLFPAEWRSTPYRSCA